MKNLFEELLESLSYTGVGGKKSTGLGRFEYQESEISTNLEKKLQKAGKINIKNLLRNVIISRNS